MHKNDFYILKEQVTNTGFWHKNQKNKIKEKKKIIPTS